MRALGLNLGKTILGKQLRDGGVALADSEKIVFAVQEERLSYKKYDGGFYHALNYIDNYFSNNKTNLNIVVQSSCCEIPRVKNIPGIDVETIAVNHHLSHATFATHSAQFEKSIVCVFDSGGNILSNNDASWWSVEREQHSYFLTNGTDIKLIERDCSNSTAMGLGEFWRYITYGVGFDSSVHAAKVMEMASFSKKNFNTSGLFYIKNGMINSDIRNDPKNPHKVFRNIIDEYYPLKEINSIDVAAWAQFELFNIVKEKILLLSNKYSVSQFSISGGVGLNCTMIGKLKEFFGSSNVHVNYAPSDMGQCIGNAIHGINFLKKNKEKKFLECRNPFLGRKYNITRDEIRSSAKENSVSDEYLFRKIHSINNEFSNLVKKGYLFGTFFGREEFGARSLGNRSLICRQDVDGIKLRINFIKSRDKNQPVAPVLPNSIINNDTKAQYMETIIHHKSVENLHINAVHVDGTARIQTGPFFSGSIFNELSGKKDILLNTSFNGKNEPIVGTPKDAVKKLAEMKLDAVLFNEHVLIKKDPIIEYNYDIDSSRGVLNIGYKFISEKLKIFCLNNKLSIVERNKLSLYENYVRWFRSGRKITTIRYVKDGLSVPIDNRIPLSISTDFSQKTIHMNDMAIEIVGITIKKFSDLDYIDAERDGFKSTHQMKSMLKRIYPNLNEENYVTINFIREI